MFRRPFFKFAIVPLVIVGTLGGVVAFAGGPMAARHFGPHMMGHGPGPHGPFGHPEMREHVVDMMIDVADATDEQESEIRGILDEVFVQLDDLRPDDEAKHAEIKAILTAKKIDRKALQAHRAEVIDKVEQASGLVVDAVIDVAEVLDQEQRQKIADHMESRHAMMEAMFKEGK
ncbi:MAG: Spy/CpxP family protein refolding chaperone [Proteobacteria bacterium]|jgi:Spy/CpxP family protein refolding chaperone|nr:Spy/CpxP family protein refolding chaperone [Pseudomonadota bacterium]